MIKICDTCHKEFISKSSRNRFCSKICCNVTTKLEVIQKQQITVFKIFERDNFRCIYCGKSSIEDGVKLHIDHVYPISKHGDNNLNNLVTSCEYCNLSKGNRSISEEAILRIWKRNDELNCKLPVKDYNELKTMFDYIFKYRKASDF